MDPPYRPVPPRFFLLAALCYLLFVVYGSLLPLDFHPKPLAAAWREFLDIRYFALGIGSRADWVANILLYIPLSFLASAVFAASGRSMLLRGMRWVCVFALCAALAAGVEFAQMFFPPRTVSLNDIVAELLGTLAGIGAWEACGDWLLGLWRKIELGGAAAIRAVFTGYALVYLALSLFPYDFLISAADLAWKFQSENFDLFFARRTCNALSICAVKLLAECVAMAPLGVLMSLSRSGNGGRIYGKAFLTGAVLGVLIEAAQFLVASGISQGVSVLTRAAGFTLGVAVHRTISMEVVRAWRPRLRAVSTAVLIPYLLAVMWVNGWFSVAWGGWEHASRSFEQIKWLPFHYHYFTTETAALVSALAYAAMYLPVGIGFWLWQFSGARGNYRSALTGPAMMAALLATVMESGKLFIPGKHADPTSILIAGFAAAVACLFAQRFAGWSSEVLPAPAAARAHREDSRLPRVSRHRGGALLAAGLLLAAVGMAVARYPLPGPWLVVGLAVYALVIWRFPSATLPAVLALLPLLNLAPWTGWVLLDEFDLLIGVTLAVHLMNPSLQAQTAGPSSRIGWPAGLLAASFLVSAAVGLLPLQPFDVDALHGYFSNYNSLRALKGFVWAWALLPVIARPSGEVERFEERIVTGIAAGLCAVGAVVLWERYVFSGLFNFSNDYRITATFPEMHTGGAFAEGYLATAIPFAVAWIALRPDAIRIVSGTMLFALASYALAVTFARAGYLGYAGAVSVLGIAAATRWAQRRAWKPGRIVFAIAVPLAGMAVIVPIMTGSFMQSRFAASQEDMAIRTHHWADAIDMMDAGAATALFGMGLGSFPRTYLLKAPPGEAPATFSYQREGENGFVRLGSGKMLYLGQRVPVGAGQVYTLSLDLRSDDPKASVAAPVCEKSELYSFRCEWVSFSANAEARNWRHHEVKFDSKGIGQGAWFARRPVVLGLHNSGGGTRIDVDNVRLLDSSGRDLIANGDFSRAGDRWYFATDIHLPWHIKHLGVQILFEQGWFGVFAIGIVIVVALRRLTVAAWRGDLFSATLLAALCGFMLVGLFDSLFDAPRLTTLFFLLLFLALRRV